MFTLLLVLPVSSCEDERIFSSLRRLKKYLCSTMTQRRINSITFLHVLLGLAIFCAMYLCYVFSVWTLYLPCIEFYLQDCAFVTFIYLRLYTWLDLTCPSTRAQGFIQPPRMGENSPLKQIFSPLKKDHQLPPQGEYLFWQLAGTPTAC